MSGRLLARGYLPHLGRMSTPRTSSISSPLKSTAPVPGHQARSYVRLPTAGLLRADAAVRATRKRLWVPGNAFHNAVIVRNASFARLLPKLVIKFVRVPAMFGGLAVGAFAYVQYQANQAGAYAMDVFHKTLDNVTEVTSTIFVGAKDVAEQASAGWKSTKENMPDWVTNLLTLHEQIGTGEGASSGGSGGNGGDGRDPKQSRIPPVAAAAGGAAAYAYGVDDDRKPEDTARDDQMMVLTKKMIEIRNILKKVGQSSTLTLPSIVVIGSQSSGKSSVLEAIVGHEFLPKGANMVTRRPIELTLVNTPDSTEEYGEFPDLGIRKMTDFGSIQRTLTDLNLAVPESECVSDDPILLSIYSPNVPDLSLIDLPGYIQVVGRNQPLELKQRISELCDKYIQRPNVILAISAADVDLANSAALRASRRVDPRGERTIGVVTKMDLVEPARGTSILTDTQYPLRLGYVGVVSKAPTGVGGLFVRGTSNLMTQITKNENGFFNAHPQQFGPESGVNVGTNTLRRKLMTVLEQTMSSSLQGTSDVIRQELEEATYEFKVQYNDRPLSAESYLAESLDSFKVAFKHFTEEFGRPQMHTLLKNELDQKVLDLLAARYWNKPIADLSPARIEPDQIADLPRADPDSLYWHRQLDASVSALTKLGVGRLATTVVAHSIQSSIDSLINGSTFVNHPFARQTINEAASTILNERFYSTSDQVENCIKPYKFEIDIENREWNQGRENAGALLKKELSDCELALKGMENQVGGRRKLREVMNFVDKARKGDVIVDGDGHSGAGGFSAELLARGREAIFLRDRADIIKMRLMAVKSKQCSDLANKYYCPEVFLNAAATKLASTAVLFLNVELLSEFYYNFPRELDLRLGRHLSDEDIEKFAKEDPKIKKHLDVIRRKEMLELVLEKMEGLKQLEGAATGRSDDVRGGRGRGTGKKDQERGRWGLF